MNWSINFICIIISLKSERTNSLRKEINILSKKLDWRPFNIKYEAWCAMFVRLMLKKSWFNNAARKMNWAALSALFNTSETWYHIWISIWWWGWSYYHQKNYEKTNNPVSKPTNNEPKKIL